MSFFGARLIVRKAGQPGSTLRLSESETGDFIGACSDAAEKGRRESLAALLPIGLTRSAGYLFILPTMMELTALVNDYIARTDFVVGKANSTAGMIAFTLQPDLDELIWEDVNRDYQSGKNHGFTFSGGRQSQTVTTQVHLGGFATASTCAYIPAEQLAQARLISELLDGTKRAPSAGSSPYRVEVPPLGSLIRPGLFRIHDGSECFRIMESQLRALGEWLGRTE